MFLFSQWMQLSLGTKALLAQEFGFAKTGPTHVSDNRVVQDGYKVADVENAMSIEAIRKYVGESIADPAELWKAMVDKVEGREAAVTLVVPMTPPGMVLVIEDTSQETVTIEEAKDLKERASEIDLAKPFKTVIVEPKLPKKGGRPKRLM